MRIGGERLSYNSTNNYDPFDNPRTLGRPNNPYMFNDGRTYTYTDASPEKSFFINVLKGTVNLANISGVIRAYVTDQLNVGNSQEVTAIVSGPQGNASVINSKNVLLNAMFGGNVTSNTNQNATINLSSGARGQSLNDINLTGSAIGNGTEMKITNGTNVNFRAEDFATVFSLGNQNASYNIASGASLVSFQDKNLNVKANNAIANIAEAQKVVLDATDSLALIGNSEDVHVSGSRNAIALADNLHTDLGGISEDGTASSYNWVYMQGDARDNTVNIHHSIGLELGGNLSETLEKVAAQAANLGDGNDSVTMDGTTTRRSELNFDGDQGSDCFEYTTSDPATIRLQKLLNDIWVDIERNEKGNYNVSDEDIVRLLDEANKNTVLLSNFEDIKITQSNSLAEEPLMAAEAREGAEEGGFGSLEAVDTNPNIITIDPQTTSEEVILTGELPEGGE